MSRELRIAKAEESWNWRRPLIHFALGLTGSSIPRLVRQYLELEHRSPEELDRLQRGKRERLVAHAVEHVPYYRERLRGSRLASSGRVDLGRWAEIPILTKSELRAHLDELQSNDIRSRRVHERFTSGSTGIPAVLFQDRHYWQRNVANKLYFKVTLGEQQLGEPELRLWSSVPELLGRSRPLTTRLRDWLYHRSDFYNLRMTTEDMDRFAMEWNRHLPGWVEGYAKALFEFAKHVSERDLRLHPPKGVIASAETLYPFMRRTMEAAFGAPVFNRYGSREVGDIACSCSAQEGLHVSVWNNFVEILDRELNPVEPGKLGKVYVTNLNNYCMPLIRYEIGDVATWSDSSRCSCGRQTPLLGSVEGRVVNAFKTRDGSFLSGAYFLILVHSVLGREHISQLQVVQKDYERIRIRFVPGPSQDWGDRKETIRREVLEVLGPGCQVEWERVDELPPLESGKHLLSVCEIP